jgi:3-methylcrotonyl-CoA carboxylase beta subunit
MLLPTTIDRTNETFRANDAHNRSLAAALRSTIARAARGGPANHRERHVERGKLLPRDRVRRLLDPGSPFLEIGALAANGMYDDEAPGAGSIVGSGVCPVERQ